MSYFPTNEEEISLIKFIAKYQYLNVNNAKYFFNSSRYYRNRIKNLIDKNFLRKIKWVLVLGKSGIQYVKLLNFEYNKLNKNQQYKERLLRLSNIAAFYHNCDIVDFNYHPGDNSLIVTDLLADVIIYPDGFVKVVDLDELVAALESRSISLDTLKSSLMRLDKLLNLIYSNQFDTLKAYIENY